MKCKIKVDAKVQKEVNQSTQNLSILSIIFGSIGLVAYIILTIVFEKNAFFTILLGLSIFFFGFGLIMLITVAKVNAKGSAQNLTDEYELDETFIEVKSYRNDEIVAMQKTYYKELFKFKETKSYLILYPNSSQAFVIPKADFSQEDIATIKSWVKKENPRIIK